MAAVTAVLLTLTMLLPGQGLIEAKAEPAPSGQLGDNVTYTMDGGIVTASGSGPTYDFDDGVHANPFTWVMAEDDTVLVAEIGEGITRLGNEIFSNCQKMVFVSLPSTLTSIGNTAFFACTHLPVLSIPDSVTEIGEQAFADCERLQSIRLSHSLTEIKKDTFSGCDSLVSIRVPDGVTRLDDFAISGQKSLTTVVLPASLTYIGENNFKPLEHTEAKVNGVQKDVYPISDIYYLGTQDQWNAIENHTTIPDQTTLHFLNDAATQGDSVYKNQSNYLQEADYKGHRYVLFQNTMASYDAAEAFCEGMGGHLAVVSDDGENDFLNSTFAPQPDSMYIGLSEYGGWVDGSPVTYEPLCDFAAENVPDINCYYTIGQDGGKWDYTGWYQDDSHSFICEFDYIPGSAGGSAGGTVSSGGQPETEDKGGTGGNVSSDENFVSEFDFNGHRYLLLPVTETSLEAEEKQCESLGGHLISINDQDENDALHRGFKGLSFYLGYQDPTQWINGEPLDYTNWPDPSGPNGIVYAYMDGESGLWETTPDFPDSKVPYVVCEFENLVGEIYNDTQGPFYNWQLWGDIFWRLEDTDNDEGGTDLTLHITGKGAIPDTDPDQGETPQSAPWYDLGFQKVVIDEGVTGIGAYAFEGSLAMDEFTIPSTVSSIGESAFSGCPALEVVALPEEESGTPDLTLGDRVFENDKSLRFLLISKSVTAFGQDVFKKSPSVSIYGFKDSAAESYADQYQIPFYCLDDDTVYQPFDLKTDAYSEINCSQAFGSPDYIPLEGYQLAFGTGFTRQMWDQVKEKWDGYCWGMSATAALQKIGRIDLSADYQNGETTLNRGAVDKVGTYQGYSLTILKTSPILTQIEAYQAWRDGCQADSDVQLFTAKKYGGGVEDKAVYFWNIIKAVKERKVPFIVDVTWKLKKDMVGHGLVINTSVDPVEDPQKGDGWWKIALYDPNHPYYQFPDGSKLVKNYKTFDQRFLYLNVNNGQWQLDTAINGNQKDDLIGYDDAGNQIEDSTLAFEDPAALPAGFSTPVKYVPYASNATVFTYKGKRFAILNKDQSIVFSIEDGQVKEIDPNVVDILPYLGVAADPTEDSGSESGAGVEDGRGTVRLAAGTYTVQGDAGTYIFRGNGQYSGFAADGSVEISLTEDNTVSVRSENGSHVSTVLEEVSDENDRYASLQTDFNASSDPSAFTLKDFGLSVDAPSLDRLNIEVISNDSGSDQTQQFDNVAVSDLQDWKVAASGSSASQTGTAPSYSGNGSSGGSTSSSGSGLGAILLLLLFVVIIAVVIVVIIIAVKKHKKGPKPPRGTGQPRQQPQNGQLYPKQWQMPRQPQNGQLYPNQWQQPQRPQQMSQQQPGQTQQPPLDRNDFLGSSSNKGQSSQQGQNQNHS